MGKIKLVAILIIFILSSCNNKSDKIKKEYFEDGKIKSIVYYDDVNNPIRSHQYFKNGKLKQSNYFKNNLKGSVSLFYNDLGNLIVKKYWKDSINTIQYEYYYNKKIKASGPLYNNKKNGWWNLYNSKGDLIQKDEIFTIDGKEILNQRIKYDLKGQILKSQSDVFTVELKDTLNIGKSIGIIKYEPKFSKDSKFAVYLSQDINQDFSNLNNVKLDTFYSKNKNDIWFGVETKTRGKKNIRGFLEEMHYETNKTRTDLVIKKRFKYFTKEIFVK